MRSLYVLAIPALLLAMVATTLTLQWTHSQRIGIGSVSAAEQLVSFKASPAGNSTKELASQKTHQKKAAAHSEEELEAADHDD